MLVVQVHVQVKGEFLDEFIKLTMENAEKSLLEPGIKRFDVFQSFEEETKFILNEVYLNEEATLDHKRTDHYSKWKTGVEVMMAESRFSKKYSNIFPTDEDFK